MGLPDGVRPPGEGPSWPSGAGCSKYRAGLASSRERQRARRGTGSRGAWPLVEQAGCWSDEECEGCARGCVVPLVRAHCASLIGRTLGAGRSLKTRAAETPGGHRGNAGRSQIRHVATRDRQGPSARMASA